MIRFRIVADAVPPRPFALCTETRWVSSELAVYRLLSSGQSATDRFVEICYGRERCIARLEGTPAVISRAFAALVSGTVTPCTMLDVLQDLSAGGL